MAGESLRSHKGEARVITSLKRFLKILLLYSGFESSQTIRVSPIWGLKRLGSSYGGWTIPVALLSNRSICYCIGAGEDITFDLELISKFGVTVYCFDPTPRAVAHVTAATADLEKFHFFNVGIWHENKTMKFYAPVDPAHVSHSIVNLQSTDRYFEAQCKTLVTIFQENKHNTIDLLKLDVEGAEYRILESVIRDNLQIRILCVEFDELHHPLDENFRNRIASTIEDLCAFGYVLIHIDKSNYTFIRDQDFPLAARVARRVWAKFRSFSERRSQ